MLPWAVFLNILPAKIVDASTSKSKGIDEKTTEAMTANFAPKPH